MRDVVIVQSSAHSHSKERSRHPYDQRRRQRLQE